MLTLVAINKRVYMAKNSYPVPKSNPHLQMVISFALTWVVSALVIAIANSLFPSNVVLGTAALNWLSALLLSSGVLAWLMTMAIALFTEIEVRQQRVLSPKDWMMGYFVLNAVGVWLIARLAEMLGLGVSSWVVVVVLALVLDIVQGITMMTYGSLQKSRK